MLDGFVRMFLVSFPLDDQVVPRTLVGGVTFSEWSFVPDNPVEFPNLVGFVFEVVEYLGIGYEVFIVLAVDRASELDVVRVSVQIVLLLLHEFDCNGCEA